MEKKLNKKDLPQIAYEELMKQIQDKATSPAVKVQALTQLIKLAEALPVEGAEDKLAEFLNKE